MKDARIIGKLNIEHNCIDFYANAGNEEIYIFTRKYKKSLYSYFCNGVPMRDLFDYSKVRRNKAATKTLDQLRTYLRFVEKEYSVKLFNEKSTMKVPRYERRYGAGYDQMYLM